MARVNPSAAIMLFQHYAVSARIAEWGNAAQQARLLPALAKGDLLAASGWSEPGAGAAKKRLNTTAVRLPDGRWRLNGAKSFTTSAGVAGLYLILARTSDSVAEPSGGYGSAGQTFFLVPAGIEGVRPDQSLDLIGMRGSATGFVSLHDCVVGDEDRLGPVGEATRLIAGVRRTGATLGAVSSASRRRCWTSRSNRYTAVRNHPTRSPASGSSTWPPGSRRRAPSSTGPDGGTRPIRAWPPSTASCSPRRPPSRWASRWRACWVPRGTWSPTASTG